MAEKDGSNNDNEGVRTSQNQRWSIHGMEPSQHGILESNAARSSEANHPENNVTRCLAVDEISDKSHTIAKNSSLPIPSAPPLNCQPSIDLPSNLTESTMNEDLPPSYGEWFKK